MIEIDLQEKYSRHSLVPVEQSIPVYPFSHSQTLWERHLPCPLQLLGHEPAIKVSIKDLEGRFRKPFNSVLILIQTSEKTEIKKLTVATIMTFKT